MSIQLFSTVEKRRHLSDTKSCVDNVKFKKVQNLHKYCLNKVTAQASNNICQNQKYMRAWKQKQKSSNMEFSRGRGSHEICLVFPVAYQREIKESLNPHWPKKFSSSQLHVKLNVTFDVYQHTLYFFNFFASYLHFCKVNMLLHFQCFSQFCIKSIQLCEPCQQATHYRSWCGLIRFWSLG